MFIFIPPGNTTIPNAPKVLDFSPREGQVGTAITIYGEKFTGSTGATVGGVALDSFVVVDDAIITGAIGTGTATGKIIVTNPDGTGESLAEFTIVPGVGFADITGAARDNADLETELEDLETAIGNKFGKDSLLYTQLWI